MMPRRQPFTSLCQQADRLARPELVDLHTHTSASDGDYTASQIVAYAVQARLKAVAITDHETMASVTSARETARDNRYAIEIVPGVEITTCSEKRDYHLLAYFVDDNNELLGMLAHLQECRRRRFELFLELLAGQGIQFPTANVEQLIAKTPSLGRRHLAGLMQLSGHVRSRHDAFRRYLIPLASQLPKLREVTIAQAIETVHAAGGVACLAHPSSETTFAELASLRELGLDGVEVSFPAASYSRSQQLRVWAGELGMACSGGSDCHGAEQRVGSRTVPLADLERLRQSADSRRCTPQIEQTSSAHFSG